MRNYTDKCPKCNDPVSVCFCEKEPPSDPQRESETPETDALGFVGFSDNYFIRHPNIGKLLNKCKSLERQRNEARAKLTAAREVLERLLNRETDLWANDPSKGIGLTEDLNFARQTLTQLNDHE